MVNKLRIECKHCALQEAVRGAPPPDKKLLEHQFVFACVWAFGGCMLVDKVSDYRTQFSKWWISEYKNVQFPEKVDTSAYCALMLKFINSSMRTARLIFSSCAYWSSFLQQLVLSYLT